MSARIKHDPSLCDPSIPCTACATIRERAIKRRSKTREADIQSQIRLAVGRMPDVRLWRNNSGLLKGAERPIRVGLATGSSDLIGILAPSGRFLALEVKTTKGHITEEQKQWQAIVRRFGGFAAVVRSVEEAIEAVDRARCGGWE